MTREIKCKLMGVSGLYYAVSAIYHTLGGGKWNLIGIWVDGVLHHSFPDDLFVSGAKQQFNDAVEQALMEAELLEPYEQVSE